MAYNCLNKSYFSDNKDPWLINDFLLKSSSTIQSVLNYSPYNSSHSPFVLSIEFNKKSLYLLLKNGLVIKIGKKNEKSIHNHIEDIYFMQEHPRQVVFPTKIIDISCGLEHALAKGKNGKIYSWGDNTYGQLGLNTHDVPYRDDIEPNIVFQLSQWKITQIYASEYNSFCLTSENSLFGFGNNEQGQIVYPGELKISNPIKIESFNGKDQNFKVALNKRGNKMYFSQMHLPAKTLSKSIELKEHYQHNSEEYKLITDVKQLKEQLTNLMKAKNTRKDNEHLIRKIEQLIIKYEEKGNKMQMEYKAIRNELDPGRSYDKLIDLFENIKGKLLQEMFNRDLSALDTKITKYHFNGIISNNDKDNNKQLFLKHSGCLASLLEGAASNIQIQKTKYIENLHEESKIHLNHLQMNKDFNFYIELFKEVIEEIKCNVSQFHNADYISETNSIKEKCLIEFHNFRMNTLEGITTSNVSHTLMSKSLSLNDYNNKSSVNLGRLSEKMNNLAVNTTSSNLIGRKILNIFDKNIILIHQNNYLTHFILNNIAENVYNYSVEKAIKYSNPFNYNELEYSLERFKQLYEENEDQRIRSQIKAKILNNCDYRSSANEDKPVNSELNSEDELN